MRSLRRTAVIGTAAACLWALLAGPIPGCTPGAEDFFDTPPVKIADADHVTDTSVSPVLDTPIQPNDTTIWCGTFQLAWNELADLAGGDVKLDNPPPVANILNNREVNASDFDPDSYVAAAGYVSDGIYGRIRRLMQQKFHGAHQPSLPADSPFSPVTIYAYAFLYKKLDFDKPFERFNAPLNFGDKKVAAFGLDPTQQPNSAMADQIGILDYRDEDDFIIELKTTSADDRLILAKVPPGPTLVETLDAVARRTASVKPAAALADDVLEVPKMAFDASHTFNELVDRDVLPSVPRIEKGSYILAADQDIKFQMNEKGVKLQSEAHIAIGCAAEAPRMPQHVMVFDKPFLLVMQRSHSQRPYFAAWIGNTRLMQAK